jgi:hypothetical protein
MKIVINKCYGGFGLSGAALSRYNELAGTAYEYDFDIEDRSDAKLVAVVEEMGENSFGDHAKLKVVEIPDGVEWVVEEYDGLEWVAEKHRTWS